MVEIGGKFLPKAVGLNPLFPLMFYQVICVIPALTNFIVFSFLQFFMCETQSNLQSMFLLGQCPVIHPPLQSLVSDCTLMTLSFASLFHFLLIQLLFCIVIEWESNTFQFSFSPIFFQLLFHAYTYAETGFLFNLNVFSFLMGDISILIVFEQKEMKKQNDSPFSLFLH